MMLPARLTRRRLAVLAVAVIGVPLAVWAAAPLFVEPHLTESAPADFTQRVREGIWEGVDCFHYTSGVARILGDGRGAYVLRLENFSVRNGPDIRFFLSADATVGAGDIGLGPVTATTGSYNVALPAGTDVSSVNYALVHCVPANFLFAKAFLT